MFKDEDENEGVPVEELYDKAHKSMTNGNWYGGRRHLQAPGRAVPVRPLHRAGADRDRLRPVQVGQARRRDLQHRPLHPHLSRRTATSPTCTTCAACPTPAATRCSCSRSGRSTPAAATWPRRCRRYNDFTIVAERYPNSRYAADARQRMVAPAQPVRPPRARHRAVLPAPRRLGRRRRPRQVPARDLPAERVPERRRRHRWPRPTRSLGNETLAADAKRVLQQNEPDHPYLSGDWPDYPCDAAQAQPVRGREVGARTTTERLIALRHVKERRLRAAAFPLRDEAHRA